MVQVPDKDRVFENMEVFHHARIKIMCNRNLEHLLNIKHCGIKHH